MKKLKDAPRSPIFCTKLLFVNLEAINMNKYTGNRYVCFRITVMTSPKTIPIEYRIPEKTRMARVVLCWFKGKPKTRLNIGVPIK